MIQKYLTLLFVFIFALGYVSSITGSAHSFQGNIIVEDGKNPHGLNLIGLLNGLPVSSTTIEGTSYYIDVEDLSDSEGIVSFKIGEEEADEQFNYVGFEGTNADLIFKTVMDSILGGCGDGACQAGECSSCPADCSVLLCSNDSFCDGGVGEDCSNSPEDCGVCLYCGDGVCNNEETCSSCSGDCGVCSSGGGGSKKKSSGGGGGSNTIVLGATDDKNETEEVLTEIFIREEDKPISIDELNSRNESAFIESKGFFSWITGRAVGTGVNEGIGVPGFLVLILIALVVLYLYFKNQTKKK